MSIHAEQLLGAIHAELPSLDECYVAVERALDVVDGDFAVSAVEEREKEVFFFVQMITAIERTVKQLQIVCTNEKSDLGDHIPKRFAALAHSVKRHTDPILSLLDETSLDDRPENEHPLIDTLLTLRQHLQGLLVYIGELALQLTPPEESDGKS